MKSGGCPMQVCYFERQNELLRRSNATKCINSVFGS